MSRPCRTIPICARVAPRCRVPSARPCPSRESPGRGGERLWIQPRLPNSIARPNNAPSPPTMASEIDGSRWLSAMTAEPAPSAVISSPTRRPAVEP
ncbi:hypothetical protein G6F68_018637 [Rhizopus microsporus]|nr:hypothetical protein G6F68_018637 [Rhizopus microsporus]